MISPRELAGRMTQSHSVKSAAKSAIGMAEMLAHEIKNPLAGITGAAQLLSMNLNKDDLELTDLIVGECRRIVKLLEQVEQFGNLSPPDFKPMNIHDVLDRARRSALLGFGSQMRIIEDYDPSLPLASGDPDQLLQAVLNLLKNASDQTVARYESTVFSTIHSACGAQMARANLCRFRWKLLTMVRGCPMAFQTTYSTRSFPAKRTAPGWALRWCPRLFRITGVGFRSRLSREKLYFVFPCRVHRSRPGLLT